MLSRNLEQTLRQALAQANARRHEYATLEHLLLALTEDQDAVAVMRACGVDIARLRKDVTDYIDAELANLAVSRPDDAKPTAGFQRVLQRAAIHVHASGREEVTGANVVMPHFSRRDGSIVAHTEATRESGAGGDAQAEKVVKKGSEALDAYCVNLNRKALS